MLLRALQNCGIGCIDVFSKYLTKEIFSTFQDPDMAPAPEQILLNHMVRWKQTRQKYVVPGFLKNIFIINYQQKKLIGKHNHIQVDNQLFQEMSFKLLT